MRADSRFAVMFAQASALSPTVCFTPSAVLEFAASARGSTVGPPSAAAGLGVGQDQLSPSVVGEAGEIVAAQVHDFLRPQRGVVHAAEEGNHPFATWAELVECC
jgi:hypothetical protein